MTYEEQIEKLYNESDSMVHIFVTGNQITLVHSPLDSEEEVLNILNSAAANMVMRGALDRASGNRLQ